MADTNWCCYCDKAIPAGYTVSPTSKVFDIIMLTLTYITQGSLYCSDECLHRDTIEHRRPSADVNALFDPRQYDHKMKQFLFTAQDNAPSPSSNDQHDTGSDQEGPNATASIWSSNDDALAQSQSISNVSTSSNTSNSDKITLVDGNHNSW